MKIISWNCQGLAQPKAIRALKLLLKEKKHDLIFICEIKTSFTSDIFKVFNSFSLPNNFFVPPSGLAGGLSLAWTNKAIVLVTLQNNMLINAIVPSLSGSPQWQFTGIYCPCHASGKTDFWSLISATDNNFDGPCLIMGDFNSITSQAEKNGGNSFASSSKTPSPLILTISTSLTLASLGILSLGTTRDVA